MVIRKGGFIMKKFSKKTVVITGFIVALAIGLIQPESADSKIKTNVPSDLSSDEMKALVIEDFENGTVSDSLDQDGWLAQTKPPRFKGAATEEKMKMKNPVPVLEVKFINGGPNDLATEEWSLTEQGKKKDKCLGIHFQFRYPGTNEVHIIPPKEVDWREKKPVYTYNPSTRKDEQERAIQIPGRAKGISLWVHARGKPYVLDVWVKDYKGQTYVLKMGSIDFVGWRPMFAKIPAHVPQASETYPQTRGSKITRFVLRAVTTSPREELLEDVYVFFDQLKVLTDTFEVNFDGNNLHKVFEGGAKSTGGSTSGKKAE